MDFRIETVINTAQTMNRFDPRYRKAQMWLDTAVLKDTEPYVPFQTGMLARSGQTGTAVGSGEVVYNAPYAQRLYHGNGFHFDRTFHPLASAYWFEKSKGVNQKTWLEGVQKILTE